MNLISLPLDVHRAFERRSVPARPAMRRIDVGGGAA